MTGGEKAEPPLNTLTAKTKPQTKTGTFWHPQSSACPHRRRAKAALLSPAFLPALSKQLFLSKMSFRISFLIVHTSIYTICFWVLSLRLRIPFGNKAHRRKEMLLRVSIPAPPHSTVYLKPHMLHHTTLLLNSCSLQTVLL